VKAVQAEYAHKQAQVQERQETTSATMRPVSIHNTKQHESIAPSQEEQEVWEDLGNIYDHDYGQSEADAYKQRPPEFEQKLEDYGLWDGDETPLNDEMENIAQTWEMAEYEQMLDEVLQSLGSLSSLIHKLE
jgi:hypothetical protein